MVIFKISGARNRLRMDMSGPIMYTESFCDDFWPKNRYIKINMSKVAYLFGTLDL